MSILLLVAGTVLTGGAGVTAAIWVDQRPPAQDQPSPAAETDNGVPRTPAATPTGTNATPE